MWIFLDGEEIPNPIDGDGDTLLMIPQIQGLWFEKWIIQFKILMKSRHISKDQFLGQHNPRGTKPFSSWGPHMATLKWKAHRKRKPLCLSPSPFLQYKLQNTRVYAPSLSSLSLSTKEEKLEKPPTDS